MTFAIQYPLICSDPIPTVLAPRILQIQSPRTRHTTTDQQPHLTASWHFIPSCRVPKIRSIPSCHRRVACTMYIPNQAQCALVDQLMKSSLCLIPRPFRLSLNWTASTQVIISPYAKSPFARVTVKSGLPLVAAMQSSTSQHHNLIGSHLTLKSPWIQVVMGGTYNHPSVIAVTSGELYDPYHDKWY